MGGVGSTLYNRGRRLILRYNVGNRTDKFLEREKLPSAPEHPRAKPKDFVLSEQELKEIHGKNEQLNEYLKKVYLTSTSKVIGTPSTRPKPKKENEILKLMMFLEPEQPTPGHCTLTNVMQILADFQSNPEIHTPSEIARRYTLNKKDVGQLVMYYSIFKLEKYEFMHREPKEKEPEAPDTRGFSLGPSISQQISDK